MNKIISLKNAQFILPRSNKKLFAKPTSLDIKTNEVWAITGTYKSQFLQAIAAKLPVDPPNARSYPFLENQWPSTSIRHIQFRASKSSVNSTHLGARYESYREPTDQSVYDYITTKGSGAGATTKLDATSKGRKMFDTIVKKLYLEDLLDKWIASLSNGQKRRARIARTLLLEPKLLLIDEPFIALDPGARNVISDVLRSLTPSPYVIIGERIQDPLPDWITHVAVVEKEGVVAQGPVKEIEPILQQRREELRLREHHRKKSQASRASKSETPLIQVTDLSISYGDKNVLHNVNWSIHEGDRWHLQGNNGSGKSTLIALLTADHPRSWSSDIKVRGRLREVGKDSYDSINSMFGISAPELHAIFPLKLKARTAVATGYNENGTFISPTLSDEQKNEIETKLRQFGIDPDTRMRDLDVGDQKIVLLLRAMIRQPPILLLDEALSGMDIDAIEQSLELIENYPGTIIAIGHVAEEVPFCENYIRLNGPMIPPEIGVNA
ncbi:hypothetical protein CANCADRAFT_57225 [Tortispora caseinolytica NRRL Y-17796]|uniref:ABC transporter domain-containing protein n=1 Tax=Tortispora caseinolytica NRRL Y-17796 TaxID=767744 RepID=A0A1E4TGH6_9ASCO|nr:hypothetical protein CANCADRAFT_57225 [Tortispora caseinolytica NRRL Y-17796]